MAVLETHNGYYLWKYLPSVPAAAIFILLFALATAAHCWKLYTTKAKFCWAFTIGCFFEFVGYCARASAHNKTGRLMPYIFQNFFILVAPALFAASIYMTLSRIIVSVNGEKYSIVSVGKFTKIFVAGDVVSFLMQGGSACLMFSSSTVKIGQAMVVLGLFIQVIMFGLFAVTAMVFQYRLRRKPTLELVHIQVPWRHGLHML
ncbi:hypothetical protein V491_09240 [Pseudogymnoascus sp. VKM F-3775]|nr:hypothetical protein V491_09240 [Pseudogymnoascus sp. VKM F-3775]